MADGSLAGCIVVPNFTEASRTMNVEELSSCIRPVSILVHNVNAVCVGKDGSIYYSIGRGEEGVYCLRPDVGTNETKTET